MQEQSGFSRVTDRQPRIYFPQPLESGEQYTLSADQHKHLSRVLRLRRGAELTLFDGRGGEYPATVEQVHRYQSTVRTGEHVDIERESPVPVQLAQGVGRGERTDLAIQKAVELGVTSIVPLLTRRTVVKLGAERAERRLEHWKGIIVHACQQCGRNRLPDLRAVATLDDWLSGYQRTDLDLMLDPSAGNRIGEFVYEGGLVTLLVGPEGGFDVDEIEAAASAGFRGLTLGPRTLRTETAAMVGVASIQLAWGDLGG
jgi:16S rRNA (uracil1498-N3)-methyltransferase